MCTTQNNLRLFDRYLENNKKAVGEVQIHEYSWGQRAHQEVDKKQLLSLIAEVNAKSILHCTVLN